MSLLITYLLSQLNDWMWLLGSNALYDHILGRSYCLQAGLAFFKITILTV